MHRAPQQPACQKTPVAGRSGGRAGGRAVGGKQRKSKKRDELIGEQVVSPPFPIPLRKHEDEEETGRHRRFGQTSSPAVVWPLNREGKQPFFLGRINRPDACIDIMDPASVQCLYLLGFFGKGSRSKNAPIYKIKRKRELQLRSAASGLNLDRVQGQQQQQQDRTGSALSSTSSRKSSFTRRSPVQTRHGPKKKQWNSLQQAFGGSLPEKGALVRQLYPPESTHHDKDHQTQATGASSRVTDDQSGTSDSDPESTTSSWESDAATTQPEPGSTDRPEILKLGLDEAYFLSYGLGVLSIVPEKSEDPFMNLDELWSTYRRLFDPDDLMHFPVIYAAYHFFRSRGWIVKCGLKFACDYLLYDEGPPFNHSEFAVTVVRVQAGHQITSPAIDWQHVNAMQRMSRGVRKKAILCHVVVGTDIADEDFALVSVIQKMQIHCSLMERWDARRDHDSDQSSH